MTAPAAIKGSYAHFQLVPTRKVVKIVIEAPIEQAQQVIDALGFPGANEEQWLAVAKLRADGEDEAEPEAPKPEKPKTTNAQLAGILCNDEMFWKYLTKIDWITNDAETAAMRVRAICGVESRVWLDTDSDAAERFHRLKGQYQLWRSGEVA